MGYILISWIESDTNEVSCDGNETKFETGGVKPESCGAKLKKGRVKLEPRGVKPVKRKEIMIEPSLKKVEPRK